MRSMKTIAMVLALSTSMLPAYAAEDVTAQPTGGPGELLTDNELAGLRGGQDQYLNEMELNAQLYDNQALSSVTGTNIITESAFAGAKGFATVIQNSGNNVIIQNATILNLKMQ